MKHLKSAGIISLLLLLIVIIVIGIGVAINVNNSKKIENDNNKYDLGRVVYDKYSFSEVEKMSELEVNQLKIDFIISRLEGEAKYKYSWLDEAFEGELKEYEETQSNDSLRNICKLISKEKEKDYEQLLEYYLLLFEAIRDDESFESEIGSIIGYRLEEYLNSLFHLGKKEEYIYFYSCGSKYFSDPHSWPVNIVLDNLTIENADKDFYLSLINVLKKYEREYEGVISDGHIFAYQSNIWSLTRIIDDEELEAEYYERILNTKAKILEEINAEE